ncbi:MAG: hypothetical protein OXI96_04035 [Acidimicrobiaceae bacterium]|nr:hypothetical protein [Acidimicrobiaceae bacterium]
MNKRRQQRLRKTREARELGYSPIGHTNIEDLPKNAFNPARPPYTSVSAASNSSTDSGNNTTGTGT